MSQCISICSPLSPSPVTNLWLKVHYLQNLSILYLKQTEVCISVVFLQPAHSFWQFRWGSGKAEL